MIQALPEAETHSDPTEPGTRRLSRLARRWWWVALLLVLLLLLGLAAGSGLGQSAQARSHRNPAPEGMMAIAEILEDQGVRVAGATTLQDLRAAATEGSTVFVPDLALLTDEERAALRELPSDLVLGTAPYVSLTSVTDAVVTSSLGSPTPLTAQCTDPDAAAAGRIAESTSSVAPGPGGPAIQGCFPVSPDAFAYAVWEEDGHTVRALAAPDLLTNARITSDGHAALGLRMLGRHETLVWYLPASYGAGLVEHPGGGLASVPPVVGPVVAASLMTAAVVAFWRGRRMGPVVVEPLPVIIRPGESDLGRGRLYHQAGSTGHAAAGLRAGTARRLAARLGLARATPAHDLVEAVAAATGRPPAEIGSLLYGPPPETSAHLVALANALKDLEETAP